MQPHVDRERFGSFERLYGKGALERLARAHVAVVGVGGVGSWAAEALARSGVGALTLIDADDVCLSNTNRQSHALTHTVGRAKVEVLAERLGAINPALRCEARAEFLTPRNVATMLDGGFDAVLDACDSFRVKLEAVAWCRRRKLPIVVCGSAGGRTDPTLVTSRDLSRTEQDLMLAQVRRKLRDEYGFTRNPERFFSVPAIYSREHARYTQADGSVSCKRPGHAKGKRLDCGTGFGAAMHVTATFAMVAVSRVIAKLLAKPA